MDTCRCRNGLAHPAGVTPFTEVSLVWDGTYQCGLHHTADLFSFGRRQRGKRLIRVMRRAETTFTIASWDELPVDAFSESHRITRATVRKEYRGDFEGTGVVIYLMAYNDAETASFVGIEQFVGAIGRHEGSFLIRHTGVFVRGVVTDHWDLVDESGRGGLTGIKGRAHFESGHAEAYPVTLEFELAEG